MLRAPLRLLLLVGLLVTAVVAVAFGSSLTPAVAQETEHRIQGTVLGPEGEPLAGIAVWAYGEPGEPNYGPWFAAASDTDGTFAVEVPVGAYGLGFLVELSGGECWLGFAGLDSEHSFGFPPDKRIIVSDADVTGINVRLPGTPAELCLPMQGSVTDTDGEPLRVRVAADGHGPFRGLRTVGETGADGAFTLYGPAGTYNLQVWTTAGDTCTVLGYAHSTPGTRASIELGEAGAADIHIVVSGHPTAVLLGSTCLFPPRMVTTELHPGWNSAGWTSSETDVEAIFEALPQLELAYAWDVAEERFRGAARADSGLQGDLETLAPGMGLWLHIGGEEPVPWTRILLRQSGLTLLSEGWNLVAWAGEDGATPEDAFAFLGSDLRRASVWDPHTAQFLHYEPDAPAGAHGIPYVNRGGALWLDAARMRHWLQPGSATSAVEFEGEIDAETQASVQFTVDSVLTYFAHRYGVLVPGVTFLIGSESTACGGYAAKVIYLTRPCLGSAAHEYTHAIQEYLSKGPHRSPAWMTEGIANRRSAQYHDTTGGTSYDDRINNVVLPSARLTPIALDEMEAGLFIDDYAIANYSVAHLAIDWLVAVAGEDRFFEYYRKRSSSGTWEEAFERTFGISVPDFYESFEAHRAENFSTYARIQGTLVGSSAEPLEGIALWADPPGPDNRSFFATTDSEGMFDGRIPDGSYAFWIQGICGSGWYDGDRQLTSRNSEAAEYVVSGTDTTGVVIRIPSLCQ